MPGCEVRLRLRLRLFELRLGPFGLDSGEPIHKTLMQGCQQVGCGAGGNVDVFRNIWIGTIVGAVVVELDSDASREIAVQRLVVPVQPPGSRDPHQKKKKAEKKYIDMDARRSVCV